MVQNLPFQSCALVKLSKLDGTYLMADLSAIDWGVPEGWVLGLQYL